MTELADPSVELRDSIADRRRADEASRQVAYDFHDGLLQIIFAADMRWTTCERSALLAMTGLTIS